MSQPVFLAAIETAYAMRAMADPDAYETAAVELYFDFLHGRPEAPVSLDLS